MRLSWVRFRDFETSSLSPPVQPGQGLPDWVFTGESHPLPESLQNTLMLNASQPLTEKLVAKPDQLIKRRGKAGLLCLNKDHTVSSEWVQARAGKPVTVEKTTGTLNTFILEPFLPHPQETEFYVCVNSAREGDWILFTHEGGVEVGDVDAKAKKLLIPVDGSVSPVWRVLCPGE
jgi:ATP citrate (pro-S)-lyase